MSMKKLAISIATITALGLSGCGQKSEESGEASVSVPKTEKKMVSAYITQMTEWVETIESVTDRASAEKAAPKIAKIKANMDKLSEGAEGMNTMKGAQAFGNKSPEFQQLQARMMTAMQRIVMTDPSLIQIMNAGE